MSYRACMPVLLVEGDGDTAAVPFLLRRLFGEVGAPDCQPASRPIRCGDIPKVRRPGELEKFVEYACIRTDGDSVLLLVDCEDDCPKDLIAEFVPRAEPIARRFRKKVGFGFFWREFETMFLFSLGELAGAFPDYAWTIDPDHEATDWTRIRDAKGRLDRAMLAYHYKETRDQPRFVSRLDLPQLRRRCRTTEHLFRLLEWLGDDTTTDLVYPPLPAA